MRTFLILLIAGLCLAIFFTTGCHGGLIAPPTNTGEVTITDDGDGILVSREPVVISWNFVPNIDRFKVEYSINGENIWFPIRETEITRLEWEIPAGTNTEAFVVQVVGYSNQHPAPQSRAISTPAQVIPYGPLDHYVLEADAETAVNLVFNMPVTAKDQYNNTITNYSVDSLLIEISPNGGATWIVLDTYTDLVWVNGITTSLNGVIYLPGLSPDTYYYIRAGGINSIDQIYLVANGVYIDAPTSVASSWTIGETNDIVFRAGGSTTVDYLNLYYSPNNGTNWYTIENGVAPGSMPQTYNWPVANNTPGSQWKVKVESWILDGNPGDTVPGDGLDTLIATGTSAAFTVSQ